MFWLNPLYPIPFEMGRYSSCHVSKHPGDGDFSSHMAALRTLNSDALSTEYSEEQIKSDENNEQHIKCCLGGLNWGRNKENTRSEAIKKVMVSLNLSREAADVYVFSIDNPPNPALTTDEFIALEAYLSDHTGLLNYFLMAGERIPFIIDWIDKELIRQVVDLNSAIKKIPPYPNKEVFRGQSLSSTIFDSINIADIVTSKKYLSTSLDEKFVNTWISQTPMKDQMQVKMTIKVKKSAHPITLYSNSATGLRLKEAELLIDKNTYFEVMNKTQSGELILKEVKKSNTLKHNNAITI